MKSEHRHELAENDLSKILARWMKKFDDHANTILSVAVVVALIAAAVIYWTRTSRFERANGWTQLAACRSAEDFANVADAFSGSPVSDWARLRAADGYLEEGVRLSISDRPASNDRLEQAREAYQSLTAVGTLPVIREQAMNGLAVTQESLSDGDTASAITAYQDLLTAFPETRFKAWAEDRIDALKTGSAQEFYAWFHSQNPRPADIPLPQDRSSSSSNPLGSLLPEFNAGGLKLSDEPFTPPLAEDDETKTDGEELNPFEPKATDGPSEEDLPPAEGDVESPAPTDDEPTSPESSE